MSFFRQQSLARQNTLRLLLLYAAAVAATVTVSAWVFGSLSLWLSRTRIDPFWHYAAPAFFVGGMTLTLSLLRIRTLKSGGGTVARALGGERITLEKGSYTERRLLNVVAETAVAAKLPVPAVYLLVKDHSINAFAAGNSRHNAVIGVTRGAVDRLSRDQLQAIVAHEFSHILNGDMQLNHTLSGWLYGLQSISSSGRYLVEGRDEQAEDYRRRKNVDNHLFDNTVEILMQSLPFHIVGGLLLVLGAVGSLCAAWIQAAVSRQREYLADASAVQFTRQRQPLIDALLLIARESSHRLHAPCAKEYAHMMFSGIGVRRSRLSATHPTVLERISRLDPAEGRRLAGELADLESIAIAPEGLIGFGGYQPADNLNAIHTELAYRNQEAAVRSRIRRHRGDTPVFRLPADWQPSACDNEYANAALLVLCNALQWAAEQDRQPENAAAEYALYTALPPIVHQQLSRLAAKRPPRHPDILEQLLPALVMQDESSLKNVLAVCRAAVRAHPTQQGMWLLLLADAYLFPVQRNGWRTEADGAAALHNADALSPAELAAAFAAADTLTDQARLRLLRPLASRFAETQPLLWRLLCVRLDIGIWAVGV